MAQSFKRTAEVKGKKITIHSDSKTVVTRDVRKSDKEEWPEAFKAKPKARPKAEESVDADTAATE